MTITKPRIDTQVVKLEEIYVGALIEVLEPKARIPSGCHGAQHLKS